MMYFESYHEYEYDTKKVKIDGRTYDAYFPKKHSAVQGVVWEWRDDNADDGWANISDWRLTFLILPKGSKKWEIQTDKGWRTSDWRRAGLLELFLALESPARRNQIKKRLRVKELKTIIKDAQKELNELLS